MSGTERCVSAEKCLKTVFLSLPLDYRANAHDTQTCALVNTLHLALISGLLSLIALIVKKLCEVVVVLKIVIRKRTNIYDSTHASLFALDFLYR